MEQRKTINPIKVAVGLFAIAMIGVGVLGIRDSYSAKVEPKKTIKTEATSNVDIDKMEINRELNKLYYALVGALDTGEEIQNRAGNGEILSSPMEKFKFAFFASYYNADPNETILDTNALGFGITGSFAIKLSYFREYYKNLLNEEFDIGTLNNQSAYTIKDDYIYGSIMSGLSFSNTTLKVRSVNKAEGKYNVLIDCIVSTDDDYTDYAGDSITDYPDSVVSYNIKLIVSKNGSFYTIESMVAY